KKDDRRGALAETAGAGRAPEADRHANGRRKEEGDEVQLERGGHLLEDQLRHRAAIDDRAAQVESEDAAQPVAILRRQRLVEMVLVPDGLQRGERDVHRSALADVEL